jgi:hypothetical protein
MLSWREGMAFYMRRGRIGLALLFASASLTRAQTAAAPSSPSAQTLPPLIAPQAAPRNDYANPDTWLCRPGMAKEKDACAVDLSTTVIASDGKTTLEPFMADPAAPIDCFYVYPTVSNDPGGNATMQAGAEEKAVVRAQFARFASKCRLYAPLYRQATLAALRAAAIGHPISVDRDMIYNDVLDAWNYYLTNDNHGRGVVLIGHSQGSNVLILLIKNEIDGKPVQSRMVSALLLGANVPVPKGKAVGGAFEHTPICQAPTQSGCVISYVSFRNTQPPTADGRFGHVPGENMQAACTNPATLSVATPFGAASSPSPAEAPGELHAYLGSKGVGFVGDSEATPGPWLNSGPPITTPFVSVPELLTAECVTSNNLSYLSITVHANTGSPRVSNITGDVVVNGHVRTEWGLHLIDVSIAMGNLLDIVGRQSKTFLAAAPRK